MSKVYVCVGTSKNDTGINAGWLSVGTSKLTTSSVVLKNEHNALDAEIHYIVIGQAQQWGYAKSASSSSPRVTITYPLALKTLINAQFAPIWNSTDEKYAGRILKADTNQIAVYLAGSNQSISIGCYVFIVGI